MSKPINERTTVKLDVPFKRGEHEISEIQVRRPSAGELRGLNLRDVITMEVDALIKVLPRVTAPAITEQEIYDLDPADLGQLGGEVAGFFMTKAERDSLTA